MRDAEKQDWSIYQYHPPINAWYDYSASGISWRCIANVNEIIESKSVVSRGPQKILTEYWYPVG